MDSSSFYHSYPTVFLVSSREGLGRSGYTARGTFAILFLLRTKNYRAVSILLLIFLIISSGVWAADRTAEEAIREGERAMAAKRWAEAARLYEQFLKDFASRAAPPLVSRIRYAIARCYMSQGDFSAALPAIENAMASFSSLTKPEFSLREKNENLFLWKGLAQLETGAPREAAQSFSNLLKLPLSQTKHQFFGEVLLLRAIALIQSGNAREAIQWMEEQNAASLPDYDQMQMRLLKVEAFRSLGDDTAALEILLQTAPLASYGAIRYQLLALQLAQNLVQQGKSFLALRALSILRPQGEILQRQNKKPAPSFFQKDSLLIWRCEQALQRNLKEFEKFRNWEDSVLLLRATAFLDLQRHREAALALEALQNIGGEEFITTLRCWLLAENPKRCLNFSQKLSGRFSESTKSESQKGSLSRLMEGTAYLMLEDYDAAIHSFRSLQSGEFMEHARVQEVKTLLLAHREEEALQVIHAVRPTSEEMLYLRGVAHSNREEYDACREAMSDLLRCFPQGERVPAAYFLRASAAYRKMDFPLAISELRETLLRFPGAKDEPETLLLLGNALLDQGKIEEGITTYRNVPCSSLGFHEIAVFRLGKALKKLGRLEELKKEMERFRQDHPKSTRLAEAVREIGWISCQQNRPDFARNLYWETLEEQGNDPDATAIETLLQDLQKLYSAEGKVEEYRNRILQIRKGAIEKRTLTFRMVWAESRFLKDPWEHARFLSGFIKEEEVQLASARILADFADAFFEVKNLKKAKLLYQSILKWHPSANERDRALAGLARHAAKTDIPEKALSYWRQLLKQTPESRFVPEAELAISWDLIKTKQEQATTTLQGVLRHDLATRAQKVEALYWLGEIQMNNNQPGLAMPYFQRIYIAYGAEKNWVAKAYLRSATAFEMLGDMQSVRRTYQEMIARKDLVNLPEFRKAKEKLTQLSHLTSS